ncbi:hypothetical protein HQ533_04980 [Candidatus Woesearchaeota archaeon]|nr:hypothetical protein [Candidatus Woesearchaeota archaeon]
MHNDQIIITFSEDLMIELGERILKEEKAKPDYYESMIEKWKGYDKAYKEICQKIESLNLKELSNQELKEIYSEFNVIYSQAWEVTLTTNNISYYTDNVYTPKILKKYGEDGLKDFLILATPTTKTFIKKEEEDLFKLAIKKKQGKDISKELEDHANKYHWLKNNYRDVIRLDEKYFLDHINNIKNPEKELEKLENELLELKEAQRRIKDKFSDEEVTQVKLIRLATTLQDDRKKNNLMGDYYLLTFIKEIERRTDYNYRELCYTTIEEMKRILDGEKVSDMKDRLDYCVKMVNWDCNQNLGGEEAKEMFDILENIDQVKEDITEVKGAIASPGKVKGVARIVLDVSKVKVFNKGDILISSMTRPEFIPLMKIAKAIVTDEGGITCHAAIVSRELGIPCVIGTKIATKIFKDDDLVEVDANKGVVKKI